MTKFWIWTKRLMLGLLSLILVLATLVYALGASARAKLMRENPPPGQLVDVGGYRMHLYCTGEGDSTVILDAGLNDFFVSWAKVQPEIAKAARVCSYDRAGLGWSEAGPYPRTNELMAEELHALLTNAGVKSPYILVGHSFGGITMRVFALMYPDEVTGMVLVDSAHENQIARLPFLQDATEQLVSQFRTLSFLSTSGLMALSPATIPNRGFPDEAYQQYQAVLATTDYFENAIAESTSFYFAASSSKPSNLGDVSLIVLSHGLTDMTSGVGSEYQEAFEHEWSKMQLELVGLSSNSRQVIAGQSGHYIQLDQPELVVEAVLELLK